MTKEIDRLDADADIVAGQRAPVGAQPPRPGSHRGRRDRVHRRVRACRAHDAPARRRPGRRGDVALPLRPGTGEPPRRRGRARSWTRCAPTPRSSTPRATGGRTSCSGWPTAYAGWRWRTPRCSRWSPRGPRRHRGFARRCAASSWVEAFLDGLTARGVQRRRRSRRVPRVHQLPAGPPAARGRRARRGRRTARRARGRRGPADESRAVPLACPGWATRWRRTTRRWSSRSPWRTCWTGSR